MIRPLRPDDALSLYEMFREPSLHTCDYFEPGAEISSYQAFAEVPAGDHHRLVAYDGNRLLGLGVLERPPHVRVAHLGRVRLLLPDCEHSVDASGQLLEALVDLADNWLNLKRLDAEIPSEATRIETSLKRTGFDYEGATLKSIFFESEYHDETVLARLRGFDTGDHKTRPAVTYPRKSGAHVESSGVQIRQMTSDDIDDLYEIFRAPENCRTTLQLPSQELWLTRQRVLEPPANMTRLVAVCDGRAVGMVSMMRHKPACRAHVAAIGMMVHPEFWRQRIGSRLMEELLEIADNQLNLTRIELQVHADNPAGIRLYEKCGFVVEGTKQFHTYGDGGWANTHIMARLSI